MNHCNMNPADTMLLKPPLTLWKRRTYKGDPSAACKALQSSIRMKMLYTIINERYLYSDDYDGDGDDDEFHIELIAKKKS